MKVAGRGMKKGMKEENAMRDLRAYPLGLPSAGVFSSLCSVSSSPFIVFECRVSSE